MLSYMPITTLTDNKGRLKLGSAREPIRLSACYYYLLTYLLTYLLKLSLRLCCVAKSWASWGSVTWVGVASTPKIYRLALFDRPVIYDSCGLERVSKNFEP